MIEKLALLSFISLMMTTKISVLSHHLNWGYSPNTSFEYAHRLTTLKEFNKACELYNSNIESYSYLQYDMIYPIIANYKTNNRPLLNAWLENFVVMNYTKDINFNKQDKLLSMSEVDTLNKLLTLKIEQHNSLIKLNYSLYNKIKEIGSIDQFIRISEIIKPDDAIIIDSQYIFNELMDILHSDFEYFDIQDAQVDLYLILIHQTDYSKNFENILDLGFPKKLMEKNIISPFQYAYIMDMYKERKKEKMIYGTLYTIGMKDNLLGYDLSVINKARLGIGLSELEYDYRNVHSLLSEAEIISELMDKN